MRWVVLAARRQTWDANLGEIMTTMTKAQQAEAIEAQEALRAIFPVGSTARTILRHVSQSGMSRSISVVTGDAEDVTWLVRRALGERFDDRHGGIKVGGCGMDMGFHLVYGMSRTLYPNGHDCTGSDGRDGGVRCPSNDHSNDRGARDYSTTRHHESGGYAVSQRWL